MGRTTKILTTMEKRDLEHNEEQVMNALVLDIRDCQDPVDQFKLIERYNAFVTARAKRLESEASRKTAKG
jgi:hypothetical protein